ncbi:MAG: fibronectin type III domain-containing protein [Eubacteriales bacterium]|nr:fibronectin type III domain-containing protein [Eubacteriales bacterium]
MIIPYFVIYRNTIFIIVLVKKKQQELKTVKTVTITPCLIKDLTPATLYTYRVRGYKVVNGKRTYGAWSSVKSIKCK